MEKYENLGVTATVTKTKLKIEVSISGLVNAFENSEHNCDDYVKIKRGKRKEFARFIAQKIIDSADTETGNSYVLEMFDNAFDSIHGCDDMDEEIFKYQDEDEE